MSLGNEMMILGLKLLWFIQSRAKVYIWLLNKPYVNEVTLTEQNAASLLNFLQSLKRV